jgi:Coenzyme PQQ synthesis protein D (PqqD)
MSEQIPVDTIVVAAKDQVSCDLGGESAILSLKNGVYYSLDPVGARVWKLIEQPCTVRAVRDALLEEYDVEAECCETDLQELLGRLLAEGLIEVRG